MQFMDLVSYLSRSFGYAISASVLLSALGWLSGFRLDPGRIALVVSTCFVVFLAISPFPAPGGLDCSGGGPEIQTRPFGFLEAPARLWAARASFGAWLTDLTVTSTIMNVVFFAVVGASLGTQTTRLGRAVLFGSALTLGIEVAQLTGLFGLYPCRYRTVDVDDLMLNVAGVVLGVAAMRWLRPGQKTS